MFPLPIVPAQAVVPGVSLDLAPTGSTDTISEGFAALLLLLTPRLESAAELVDGAELPQQGSTAEKGARPEAADSDLEMIAALFATVAAPQQVPPESGRVELPIAENSPAPPTVPSRLQPILSFSTGASADPLGDGMNPHVIPENVSLAPDGQRTTLAPRLFDIKDESIGRKARVSGDTPTLSAEDSTFSVFVSRPGEAEKIPSAIRELVEKSGAAEKNAADVSHEATDLPSPLKTIGSDPASRGLAVADAQVDKHLDGTSLLPSERSGFFSHDNNRGGDREAHAGGTPNQQPFAHGVPFQPVEIERAAAPTQNHAWSATIERLAAEISSQARSDRQEISMRLEPPELGRVKIELALDGGRLEARVTTEFAEAGALIQSHVQELRQALQAHSLDLISVQVDLGGSSGFSSNLQQGAESGQNTSPEIRGILPVGDSEAGEQQRLGSLDRGAVSVWA